MANQIPNTNLPKLGNPQLGFKSKERDRSTYIIVDEFNSAYYSGLDLSIYFDKYFLDEGVSIQYQVVENVLPFYGYNDYIYNFSARGTRIIQGSFNINFKRSFYLIDILKRIKNSQDSVTNNKQPSNSQKELLTKLNTSTTIEEALSYAYRTKDGTLNAAKLDELSKSYREKFWGRVIENPNAKDVSYIPINKPLYDAGKGGFTIYMKYGDADLDALQTTASDSGGTNVSRGFVGTTEALTGVHITGVGKVVDDSGRVILETYAFQSSDLISLG